MRVFSEADGKRVELDSSRVVGRGGEATVYPLRQTGRVAKLYHQPSRARGEKLRLMVQRPPNDDTRSTGWVSIAWPEEILVDSSRQVVGFTMPAVAGSHRLAEAYHPRTRAQLLHSGNDLRFLVRTARNLASIVAAVHDSGYVMGDFNDLNVLIAPNALVSLIDCDSFQVGPYRCGVGRPEYMAPELHGANLGTIDRRADQDCFSLGIAVHQLMMGGFHPYAGVGEPGELPARITRGLCPYAPAGPNPPRFAPSADDLPPRLRELFKAAFVDGHGDPGSRPTALEWRDALWSAERELMKDAHCGHYHFSHVADCPECRRQAERAGHGARPTRGSRAAGTGGGTGNARRSAGRRTTNNRAWLATVAALVVSVFGLSYLYLYPLLMSPLPTTSMPESLQRAGPSVGHTVSTDMPAFSGEGIRSGSQKSPTVADGEPVPQSGTDIIREIRGAEPRHGPLPPRQQRYSNPSEQGSDRGPVPESGSEIIRQIREKAARSGP